MSSKLNYSWKGKQGTQIKKVGKVKERQKGKMRIKERSRKRDQEKAGKGR